MDEIIGLRPSPGSLAEYGVTYAQVDLTEDGNFDFEGIRNAINERTKKLVEIQRSKGYAVRPTLSCEKIGEAIAFVKSIRPDIICMVDNCYGEFVQEKEPTDFGADLIAGSLIKKIREAVWRLSAVISVEKKQYVENAAYRLTTPGLGKKSVLR